MRDYARLRPRFWITGTGKSLRGDPSCQVVAVYLMSCPTSNMIGLYHLALPTLAHETGIPFEGASKALRRLIEAQFAEYDEANEVVWVPAMAREQLGDSLKRGDKRCAGVVNALQPYRNTPLFFRFVARYGRAYHLPDASSFEAPSKPLRSIEQEQEQEQEQEFARDPCPADPVPPEHHAAEPDGERAEALRILEVGHERRHLVLLAAPPAKGGGYRRALADTATWLVGAAAARRCSIQALADELLDAFYADARARAAGWPMAYLGTNPSQYLVANAGPAPGSTPVYHRDFVEPGGDA